MKTISVKETRVYAKCGCSIWDCVEEATILALTEQRTVILVHNEKKYKIEPNKLIECIINNEQSGS